MKNLRSCYKKDNEKNNLVLGQALDNEKCNPDIAAYKVVKEFIK